MFLSAGVIFTSPTMQLVSAFNVNLSTGSRSVPISSSVLYSRDTSRDSSAVEEKGEGHGSQHPMSSRRDVFKIFTTASAAMLSSSLNPDLASASSDDDDAASESAERKFKVLVMGGTGFVGSEICNKLNAMGIGYVSTSRDGRDGTIALDFSDPKLDIASKVEDIVKQNDCTAVISTVGAIGTGENVRTVNAGTGIAAVGAKKAGVEKFVYISVAPEVKDSVKGIQALQNYMEGKRSSEDSIKTNFAGGYTLVEPTFIYGGDKFALNPPRVADGYGRLVEGLLSSAPFRAAAGVSPGIIGVALEPPVKVSSVAGAAIAGALGLPSKPVLDTYDEINKSAGLLL